MGLSEVLILVAAVAGFATGYLAAVLRHGDTNVGTPSASHNTGSPKLPPCNWCDGWSERSRFGHYLYCPECGRQLRAGA